MAADAPLLSIVLSNYNHAAYLPESLGAILPQLDGRMELIVVDDASTDDSVAVIERLLEGRGTLVLREKNGGAIAAYRTGWTLAHGRYLYLPAADDRAGEGFFAKSLALLTAHPEAGLSCAQALVRRSDGHERIDAMGLPEGYTSPARFREHARRRGSLSIPSVTGIFRRDAFLEFGGFDERLAWHCDWFLHNAIALRYGLCHLPETLALFREGAGFSGASRHTPAQRRAIVNRMLERLDEPACRPVRAGFREPALIAFTEDAPQLWLAALVRRPASWGLLTPRLPWRIVREGADRTRRRLRSWLLARARPLLWRAAWGVARLGPLAARRGVLRLFGAPPEVAATAARSFVSEPWKAPRP